MSRKNAMTVFFICEIKCECYIYTANADSGKLNLHRFTLKGLEIKSPTTVAASQQMHFTFNKLLFAVSRLRGSPIGPMRSCRVASVDL